MIRGKKLLESFSLFVSLTFNQQKKLCNTIHYTTTVTLILIFRQNLIFAFFSEKTKNATRRDHLYDVTD